MQPPSFEHVLETFAGRFELRGRLGAGGMGVVHRAFDRELGREVALKTLRSPDPGLLYSLKQEFRAAANLQHPNLVQLHELFVVGSDCFFSMELVEGVSFTRFVRQGWVPPGAALEPHAESTEVEHRSSAQSGIVSVASTGHRGVLAPATRDFDAGTRLQLATAQLVTAVAALHDAGRVHCDIKPANILVTETGRLVLLDFGLSSPLGQLQGQRVEFAGTLAYAAPEQLWGEPATPATDWYSVGGVLFEALTGQLPAGGENTLSAQDVDLPSVVAPAFLETVAALLAPRPAERPPRESIARQLGAAGTGAPAVDFVGRSAERRTLALALQAAADGWLSVVDVQGESGIGKTELVRRFALDAERQGALVARAQCRLAESVSHQALDQIIDDLSAYLLALPRAERVAFLPEGFASLVRLFPVLGRVQAPTASASAGDAGALREQATQVLRRVLWRISGERPVVLWIDDAHWGDAESQRLLCDLFRPPAPPLLLILSHRDAATPWVQTFAEVVAESQGQWVDVRVEPLAVEASQHLARQLLAGAGAALDPAALAVQVAAEAQGLPLFLGQLCRMIAESARQNGTPELLKLTLREVIARRVAELSEPERRIVQLAALTAAPLPVAAVLAAAGGPAGGQLLVSRLSAAQLLGLSGGRAQPSLASVHQRVREAVLEGMDAAARRTGHRLLSEALERLGAEIEPETSLHHLLGAGQRERAFEVACSAARAASERFAFAHAAALYQSAIDLSGSASAQRAVLQRALADALAAAGQAGAAGEQYLLLAEQADASESLLLLQLAAENLLVGGLLQRGVLVLRRALRAARLRVPRSRAGGALQALTQLVLFRWRERGRGRRLPARGPGAPLERVRAELCLSASKGFGVVDPIASVHYAFLALNVAARAGAAEARASALCLSGSVLAALPGRMGAWGNAWLDEAAQAADAGAHALQGRVCVCRGQVQLLLGNWSSALEHCERGLGVLKLSAEQTTWEQNMAQSVSIRALEELGELKRAWSRAAEWLRDARGRGDLYAETTASLYLAIAQLAADRPEQTERLAKLTLQRWTQQPPPFQEFYRLRALAYARLYAGLPGAALELAYAAERTLRQAQLQRFPMAILEIRLLHARIRLRLAAQRQPDAERQARECERDLQGLERLRRPDASGHAALLRAGLEAQRGRPTRARELLREARRCFAERQMSLAEVYVSAAENALEGAAASPARAFETGALLRSQGILRPRAWLEMHGVWLRAERAPLAQPRAPEPRKQAPLPTRTTPRRNRATG